MEQFYQFQLQHLLNLFLLQFATDVNYYYGITTEH